MARAMVKKRPVQPLAISPAVIKKVAGLLQLFGFDQPFTVLEDNRNTWVVHLSGEDKPRIIAFQGEKPTIT
jgi:hypothetical protein